MEAEITPPAKTNFVGPAAPFRLSSPPALVSGLTRGTIGSDSGYRPVGARGNLWYQRAAKARFSLFVGLCARPEGVHLIRNLCGIYSKTKSSPAGDVARGPAVPT